MKSSVRSGARRHCLAGLTALALGLSGTACTGASTSKETISPTATPSLVAAWNMRMQSQGTEQVKVSFRPLLSSAKKYVGADYRSDGRTLWVSFKSCLVNDTCTAMSPVLPVQGNADRFTYEVLLPFKGEKVIVQGQGDVRDVLPLSR